LNSEETTARALRDLEIELTAELEHFRALAARNRLRAQRQREKAMIERERQKRRAVELRAGGRSGVRIAARMGIGLRTLRRWTVEDDAFRVAYQGVYILWKQGDDKGLKLFLAGYHPERAGAGAGWARTGRISKGRAAERTADQDDLCAIPEAAEG
jgi:hypothetical protein